MSSQSNDNINLTQSQQLTSTINPGTKVNTPRLSKFSASNSNSGSLSNLSYMTNNNNNSNSNNNKFSSSTTSQISELALKYVSHVNQDDNKEDYDYDVDNDLYDLDEQYNQLQMNDHMTTVHKQHQIEQSQKPLTKNQSKNSQNQFNTSSNNSFANQLNQHVNYQVQSPQTATQQSAQANNSMNKLFTLNTDDRLKYIEKLENEFDVLMKHKQQLDAQLTRLPFKATNTSMHTIRENIESELSLVEKKLDSVKLELRKLNILKTH
jgi:hypothetical protein